MAEDIYGNPRANIPLDGDGKAVVEVKTGNSDLTSNQADCYPSCINGGAEGRGRRANDAGFLNDDAPREVTIIRDISE